MPRELGKVVEQGLPLPLPAQGRPCDDGLLVVKEKAEEGLRDLYSVTWSHVGFLFQFEKNDCF